MGFSTEQLWPGFDHDSQSIDQSFQRDYQSYHGHQVRPKGLLIAEIVTDNDRKGVKILPGEVFCRIEFEDGILCPTAKSFSSTSGLICHIRGQHELDIQTWDGKWEGCDAEERSKGGRPTGQAIAKALVVYKQWNKLISAEDEAAEEAGKQTVNQRFAEERADKAQRFGEKRE
ncbi:hypothetical protein QC762_210835 [Podospora pseudocomata]|uniref:Uncharacterized protein n=1 Tax=Podospora pseudocomata TaxID=2093779 RepID=A0ABR0GN66_9PEZI|nr:hypothetical protein QC762_210835 [Podospora pseudocomata]